MDRALMEHFLAAKGPRYVPHQPTPKQREFLAVDALEAMFGGAAGGGKSDALLMSYFGDDKDPTRYIQTPGYSGLILRRTYADLSLPGAIMDRAHSWLANSGAHWSDVKKTWTFPLAAGEKPKLTFGYLETENDKYRYQGSEYQYGAFDELTQFTETQYTYLFSRLRRLKTANAPLRMRSATNPGGVGHKWVHRRLVLPYEEARTRGLDLASGQPVFVPAALDDNPHLDRDEYERALSLLDATSHAQLRHGSWIVDHSLLLFDIDGVGNFYNELPTDQTFRYVIGCDTGWSDCSALVVLAISNETNQIYQVDSFSKAGMQIDEFGAIIKAFRDRYRPVAIVIDPANKLAVEFIRARFAIGILNADKEGKRTFIDFLRAAIARHSFKFIAGSPVAAQMESLQWNKDRTREAEGMPADLFDSCLYAFRWAFNYANAERVAPPERLTQREAAEREAAKIRASRVHKVKYGNRDALDHDDVPEIKGG